MHIPSARIQKEMYSEAGSIWYVPAIGSESVAVLIKAPTSSIKALLAGCSIGLLFGRESNYLCTGVRIYDMPDAPMFFSGIQKEKEEHDALFEVLQARGFLIFLFSEMDSCLAWTYANLDEAEASKVRNFIGSYSSLYSGPFTEKESHVLDCFCYSIDNTQVTPNAHVIEVLETNLRLEKWQVNHNSFIGINEHHTIKINHDNEGDTFERAIWASLESVFPFSIQKSPQVLIGKKQRELVDVFAHYQYGAFLIEAKDLSILQAGYDRDQDRKTKGIQKQAKKAIKQLVGASKALARGEKVFDSKGNELVFDRSRPNQCIVLITELMHYGDWSEVERQLLDAMQETKSFFHFMDLREFIGILKACSGKAELIDYNLIERCKLFIKTKSVHIWSHPDSNKHLNKDAPKSGAPVS